MCGGDLHNLSIGSQDAGLAVHRSVIFNIKNFLFYKTDFLLYQIFPLFIVTKLHSKGGYLVITVTNFVVVLCV